MYVGSLDETGTLHVDAVAAVDHHLADGRVVEELFERAEPHYVAGDVVDEQLALLERQRRLLRFHQ